MVVKNRKVYRSYNFENKEVRNDKLCK